MNYQLDTDDGPPAPRRDQTWHWGDVLFPLGLLGFLFATCVLWGSLFPVPVPATSSVNFQGNLDAHAAPGSVVISYVRVIDEGGKSHELSMLFTKQAAPDAWDLTGYLSAREGRMIRNRIVGITFSREGAFDGVAGPSAAMTLQIAGQAKPQTLTFVFDRLTQLPQGRSRNLPLIAVRLSPFKSSNPDRTGS